MRHVLESKNSNFTVQEDTLTKTMQHKLVQLKKQ